MTKNEINLKPEKNYEFRKRLLNLHPPDIRDKERKPNKDEFEIADGCVIWLPSDATDVQLTAAKDFVEDMFTSMAVSVMLKKGNLSEDEEQWTDRTKCRHIIVHYPKESEEILGVATGYMGYRIDVANVVHIYSHDDRGTAQAFYYMEDLMSTEKAPLLIKGTVRRKVSFSNYE